VEADAVEIRVLGCLIEKQRTTPDAYPLSLNSLRLACNQTTNREPIVVYEEREIKAALDRLSNRGWTRFASGASSRALKYRQLKQRSDRLHRFASTAEVAQILDGLAGRELVVRLDRRPGQKEERWAHLLGGETEDPPAPPLPPASPPDDRLGAIEDRLARLERAFDELQTRPGP